MIAVAQNSSGTIIAGPVKHMPPHRHDGGLGAGAVPVMYQFEVGEYCIQGLTPDGRLFRPGDWAERLAGVMSCFRRGGVHGGAGAFIGYSPLCMPRTVDGVKCVIVNDGLKDVELLAWDFVMNFARDNELRTHERSPGEG